ncbi:MAG: glycerol-3-phosphate 1-O-acyltransferase PlsY [Planctomycetaceae bacterium]
MPPILLALVAAYLAGSIPFGWLVARVVKGIDIRTVGSGNIGATNVARTIGKSWGIVVLVLDALKGLVATALFPWGALDAADPRVAHVRVFCGLAAVVGHMYPCWLRFRGGKGVATALGAVIVIAPLASAIATGGFAATFGLSRIVSLSSIVAAVSFAIAALWQLRPSPLSTENWSVAAFSLAVPLLIVLRHRSNLKRLLRGEEPRFGQRPRPDVHPPADSPPDAGAA